MRHFTTDTNDGYFLPYTKIMHHFTSDTKRGLFCVFQDDLRKDNRLMEFNSIVNKFLHNDPESRSRQLHIRTYVSQNVT